MDDRSERDPDQWITQEDLAQAHINFDPERDRVPVVAGWLPGQGREPGPGHWSLGPPIGEVVDVDTDRINLWVKVRGIIDPESGEDRYAKLLQHGYTERSIRITRDRAGKGTGWALEHLAMLSMGEPPAIANMPRLDDDEPSDELIAQVSSLMPGVTLSSTGEEWRAFGGSESSGAETFSRLYQEPRSPREAEETFPMAFDAESKRELSEMISGLLNPLTTAVGAMRTELDTVKAAATDAQTKAVATETSLAAQLQQSQESLAASARTALLARRDTIRQTATRSGRMPARVKQIEDSIDWSAVSDAHIKIFEASVGALPQELPDSRSFEVRDSEGHKVAELSRTMFTLGSETCQIDDEAATVVAGLLAQATKDGQLDAKRAQSLIHNHARSLGM